MSMTISSSGNRVPRACNPSRFSVFARLPQQYPNLYICVERGTTRVTFLAQEHNTIILVIPKLVLLIQSSTHLWVLKQHIKNINWPLTILTLALAAEAAVLSWMTVIKWGLIVLNTTWLSEPAPSWTHNSAAMDDANTRSSVVPETKPIFYKVFLCYRTLCHFIFFPFKIFQTSLLFILCLIYIVIIQNTGDHQGMMT